MLLRNVTRVLLKHILKVELKFKGSWFFVSRNINYEPGGVVHTFSFFQAFFGALNHRVGVTHGNSFKLCVLFTIFGIEIHEHISDQSCVLKWLWSEQGGHN